MDISKEYESDAEWFEDWFDSKYYHILYGNRDTAEAELFMENLLLFLKPPKHARIHDLCCGKGRHSVFLSSKGFEVTGSDLSAESIAYATQFENESLTFYVNDMRQLIRVNYFDYVFNLFTSFGYFKSDRDHDKVLNAVHDSLKPGGIFVMDFLNSEKMCKMLVGEETKEAEGIVFHITKSLHPGYFEKEIRFNDNGKDYRFLEKVRAFSKADFEALFARAGFTILHFKGNYILDDFDAAVSDRLIVIAQKK
jgi:SAM-dependent methyltransferase